ncbi:MAG: FadR family transcriptional regulator [Rhizobiaceae bacterium]|nr:FadR family transcriptional regulator [Rhizobiaceae bacterium]
MQRSGEKLPSERDLAEGLNVKRHQLRKALEVMRRAGDIKAAHVRRAPSAQPRYSEELVRLTNPLEVIELRLMMEPGLARLASLRASPLEIARIVEAATTPENAAYGEADFAFHLSVAAAARNHLATEFYRMLRQVGVDARVRISGMSPPTCPKRIAKRDAEHRAIADAIARRDSDAAERAMRTHLQAVLQQINERSSAGSFAA